MKLKLFLMTAATMALVSSCSSDDVIKDNAEANAIQFSVVANNGSRAADYYCNAGMPADFNVWAEVGNKTYFAGETYERSGSTSTYLPKGGDYRYWPAEEVTFYAAKNYDSFNYTENVATNVPTINFAPKATADKQVDLIYAYDKGTKPALGVAQKLNFRHALSQIVFYAKNANSKICVEIEKISVCNVAKSGIFTLPTGDSKTTDNFQDHPNQGNGVKTTGLGTWELTYEPGSIYELTADCKVSDKLVKLTNTSVSLTDNKNTESGHTDFTKSLLVLPQTNYGEDKNNSTTAWKPYTEEEGTGIKTYSAATPTSGTFIKIYCKIRNIRSTTGVVQDDDYYIVGSESTSGAIAIPCAFAWEQGKKYVYNINFTASGHGGFNPDDGKEVLVPVKFDVTVDDFGNTTKYNFDGNGAFTAE